MVFPREQKCHGQWSIQLRQCFDNKLRFLLWAFILSVWENSVRTEFMERKVKYNMQIHTSQNIQSCRKLIQFGKWIWYLFAKLSNGGLSFYPCNRSHWFFTHKHIRNSNSSTLGLPVDVKINPQRAILPLYNLHLWPPKWTQSQHRLLKEEDRRNEVLPLDIQ